MIKFVWPFMLFSLVSVPLLIVLYVWLQRRRTRMRAALGLMGRPAAGTRGPGVRRHVPPALFLAGIAALLVGLARPQAVVSVPRVEGTVILVFDVSGSMAATDAEPTRMEAAKAAAKAFIQSQPAGVRIGIVSFSGSGFAVQAPTNDAYRLVGTIDRLRPQTGTSLGQGILAALSTIVVDAGKKPVEQVAPTPAPQVQPLPPENSQLSQLPEGSFPSTVIVLLTDGENNQSIDPLEAAQAAADRNVRINAIGFGTTAGIDLELNGFTVHTTLNEPLLQQIADATGGSYFGTQKGDPQAIYKSITPQLVVKPEYSEVTSLFAGASIVFLLLGGAFSLVWFGRIP